MTPWLLLIIAALIVACVSLYFHLKQVESQARGEQSVITDELRDAEAGLMSALEKIQRMDSALAARERLLSAVVPIPGSRVSSEHAETPPARATDDPDAERSGRVSGLMTGERDAEIPNPVALLTTPSAPASPRGWRARAAELAREGRTPLQIARDLELPVGEVELALTLLR